MMDIREFLEVLEQDRQFQSQVAGRKYLPPVLPSYIRPDIDVRLMEAFRRKGIELFYSHQVKAIDLIRKGENVVLMTPTASGKSLVYNVPVLENVLADPGAKALYVFPLKGLEQDQFKNLQELSSLTGIEGVAAVYDGDTPAHKRKIIRESVPNVLFTNPDMLHLAIIPYHRKWEGFFSDLKLVVIDELHSYRGVFGSHVSHIIRRLRRICEHYGSHPQFISTSATIANPEQLASDLTGLQFSGVMESGAPSAGRYFFFLEPIESPYTLATKLFVACIRAGIRTIVFTKARKITELIYSWALDQAPDLRDRISPYRSGFLPNERREIEARLFGGDLLGVVSTSALELGVDIGGLDCCILCGYPGSVSSTWQRAGRVGRQRRESAIMLVAIQDALDHYFIRHPDDFFEKPHEAAVIDPENVHIIKKHLVCAAAELPLRMDDTIYGIDRAKPVIDDLVRTGRLIPGKRQDILYSAEKRPHKDVNIRTTGERFILVNERGKHIGEVSGHRVFREAFPGAIYLHWGRQYIVTELDLSAKKAVCRQVTADYYTQHLSEEATEIISEGSRRNAGVVRFHWGALRIRQRVIGYDRKRIWDRVRISTHELEMPETVFETEGIWTIIDAETRMELGRNGFDLGGTLHAVEHAMISCMPLFALCDRGDVGGLSHTCFPEFGRPAIFIYDGHEGGIGLSRRAMDMAEEWIPSVLKVIEDCPCIDGCPSCIQDPHCGNRNDPLDKEGAIFLLGRWLGEKGKWAQTRP